MRRGTGGAGDPAVSLHISKLRGVGPEVRARLKVGGITYADQLLHAAATPDRRSKLQRATGLDPAVMSAPFITTLVDDLRKGPDKGWAVLADPEGNEFCVLTPYRPGA